MYHCHAIYLILSQSWQCTAVLNVLVTAPCHNSTNMCHFIAEMERHDSPIKANLTRQKYFKHKEHQVKWQANKHPEHLDLPPREHRSTHTNKRLSLSWMKWFSSYFSRPPHSWNVFLNWHSCYNYFNHRENYIKSAVPQLILKSYLWFM